jgi:hypothetical protein
VCVATRGKWPQDWWSPCCTSGEQNSFGGSYFLLSYAGIRSQWRKTNNLNYTTHEDIFIPWSRISRSKDIILRTSSLYSQEFQPTQLILNAIKETRRLWDIPLKYWENITITCNLPQFNHWTSVKNFFKDWSCGSSGRVQVWNPAFKPQSHQEKGHTDCYKEE